MTPTLLFAGILVGFLTTLFIAISVLLSLIILVQKPKGGGLAGAFGGAGGGGQVFGGKSGDVLTWITVGFFVAFILVGIALVFAARNAETGPLPIAIPSVTEDGPNTSTTPAPMPGNEGTPSTPAETTSPAGQGSEPTEPAPTGESSETPETETPTAP